MTHLQPTLVVEKTEKHDVWNVYHIDVRNGVEKRKQIAQFVQDVDGDWLLFLTTARTGGFNRHTIAELSAAFARFEPHLCHPTPRDEL